jgi:hypothetical protein
MPEREPLKETIAKGELFVLSHPGTIDTFSGYGLTLIPDSKEFLVGLLMVDRPKPADPDWLQGVETTYGECQLVPMTATGERGIACQMQVDSNSEQYLERFPGDKADAIQTVLRPFLENPPKPTFTLYWDQETHFWQSHFAYPFALPEELRQVFQLTGYGCIAAETNVGVVHICHASDTDIEGFANKPVLSQWQLIVMPTAPLIRLELTILDRPDNPFRFESFLNVADTSQVGILKQLANQEELYLSFYGNDLTYRFTKVITHSRQQWQQLDELVQQALNFWETMPQEKRDFDRAKEEFLKVTA